MIATADSNTNKAICTTNKIETRIVGKAGPLFLNKVNNKWPAIIFAVNRIARVPGRITFLIVSIHTIKGISTPGVPRGTRWLNIWFVLFTHP